MAEGISVSSRRGGESQDPEHLDAQLIFMRACQKAHIDIVVAIMAAARKMLVSSFIIGRQLETIKNSSLNELSWIITMIETGARRHCHPAIRVCELTARVTDHRRTARLGHSSSRLGEIRPLPCSRPKIILP